MAKFICKQPCWHDGHRYRLGDLINGDAAQLPHTKRGELRHFVKIEDGEPVPPVRQPEHKVTVNEKG